MDMRERDEKMLDDRAGGLEEFLGSRPEIRLSDGYPAKVLLEASRGGKPTLGSRRQQGSGRHSPHQAGQRLDQGRNRRPRTRPGLSARGLRLQASRLRLSYPTVPLAEDVLSSAFRVAGHPHCQHKPI